MSSNQTSALRPRLVRFSVLGLLLGTILVTAGCRNVGSRSTWDLLKNRDMGWRGLSQTFDHLEGGTGFDEMGETWSLMRQGPEGGFGTAMRDASIIIEPFSFRELRSTFRHLR